MVSDPLDPSNRSPSATAARLRLALQTSDDGLELKRSSIKRQHPEWSEPEIELALSTWLASDELPVVEGWTVLNPSRFRP